MKVSIGTAQWIGERERQEDSIASAVGPDGRHSLILADGMGGHAGGEIASRLATSVALEALLDPYDTVPDALDNAISRANSAISSHIETSPECDGMGTTLICVVIENGKLWWSSVGDSHLYILRSGDVKKLNADHSMLPVLQKMVTEGEITAEQAATDPKRNALRSAVMGDNIPLVDLPKRPFDLRNGDIIVLCSDGVDSIKSLSSIEAVVTAQDNAENASKSLVEAVKAVGRPRQDNTSVVVAMIEQERAPTQIENQIEEKSDILDTVRRFVLPGVTVALAVTTLWFAASSWRANSALQVTHGLIGDISAENAALEEQLELLNQSTDQVRAAQATLTNISNAVADNYNILEDLRSLENGDLSPEATSLIQFIVALISDNQTLIADSSSGDTGAKIRAQILADLLNALNSDEALENLDVLIPNIEVEALQNLARSILDLLRDADTEVQGAHLANDEMEQKISEQMERLSALSDALKNNALRDFIERYSGTVEAEIAAAAIKALVIQEPDSDPSATNGQSNN